MSDDLRRKWRLTLDPIDDAKDFAELRDTVYRNYIRFKTLAGRGHRAPSPEVK